MENFRSIQETQKNLMKTGFPAPIFSTKPRISAQRKLRLKFRTNFFPFSDAYFYLADVNEGLITH